MRSGLLYSFGLVSGATLAVGAALLWRTRTVGRLVVRLFERGDTPRRG